MQPGVTVQMQENTLFTIAGALNAQGTAADQITFTSFAASPCPGCWKSLAFVSPSTNSVLKYVIVENSGSTTGNTFQGNIFLDNASVQIENVTSRHAKEAALYAQNSSSSIKNSSFSDSAFGMKLSGAAYPQLLDGLSFANNTAKDIFIDNTAQCGTVVGGYAAEPNKTNCL